MITEMEIVPESSEIEPVVIGLSAGMGWQPDYELSLEEWRDCLRYAGRAKTVINWVLGDILNYGELRWGEMYDEAIKLTGWGYGRLSMAKSVSERVPISTRVENLTWTHHRHVADLDPDEQAYWLAQAEAEDWSTRQLREVVRQSQLHDDEGGEPEDLPFEQEGEEEGEIASETELDAIEDDPQEDNEKDKMDVHYSSEKDEWETPQDLFDAIDREFVFDLDVCASPENAKCENYFSIEDDGLNQDWAKYTCWMNPPYGQQISDWIAKAYMEALRGAMVACLVPARTDTGWWWDYCIHGEIRFIRGRLKFSNSENSAPFPSAVVVFYPTVRNEDAQVIWWGEYK